VRVRPGDRRDKVPEIDNPAYRVYFWSIGSP
jgi:hypothetical protein